MEENENDNDKDNYNTINNLEKIDAMVTDVLNNSLGKSLFENKKIKQYLNIFKRNSVANIDKNTIVYQMPFTGESKYKNYDKISTDIKKIEISIRKENELKNKKKIKSKDSENENAKNDNLYFDIFEEEKEEEKKKKNIFKNEKYNILEIIKKFKIPPEKRTI